MNLYVPSEVDWEGIKLEQTGDFPSSPVIECAISAKRKTEFTLRLLVPSWADQADVYINNEKQNIDISSNSYVSLNRVWKDNDKIRMEFQFDFHLKTMPDDENVIGIFYGPVLLAFESSSELILKGSQEEILSNLSTQGDNSFHLKDDGKTYVLRPFYEIEDQSYGVYATIRNY